MLGWIYILNGKIMHMSQIYGQDNNQVATLKGDTLKTE